MKILNNIPDGTIYNSSITECPHCHHIFNIGKDLDNTYKAIILNPPILKSNHIGILAECPYCFKRWWNHCTEIDIELIMNLRGHKPFNKKQCQQFVEAFKSRK